MHVYMSICVHIYVFIWLHVFIRVYNRTCIYRVTPPRKKKTNKKTKPINFFITSTKIKQSNSNFVRPNFCLCIIIQ